MSKEREVIIVLLLALGVSLIMAFASSHPFKGKENRDGAFALPRINNFSSSLAIPPR